MKKIAIVDGFSSGKFIAKELHNMQCKLIHISSSDKLDSYYYNSFDYSIYQENIIHSDLSHTLDFISKFGAECIIAGAESGVLLADKLNHTLNLAYSNEYAKTHARRNKFIMLEVLREHGLWPAKQCILSRWDEILTWLEDQPYPVVLKPIDSAGSDGVFICHSQDKVRHAFSTLSNKVNKLNLINKTILCQEFLHGTEYVVNFVSLGGHILVSEVVKYHKKRLASGNIVYDIDELIDYSAPEFNQLVNYVKKVCQCLGIQHGPSHAEVMLTASGPCLVEIAARSDGILRPDVSYLTTGIGQILASAVSIVAPDKFARLVEKPFYHLKNHTFNVGLINDKEAVFTSSKLLVQLKQLASFHRAEFYVDELKSIQQTTDVFSQPGTIYLISKDKAQLWKDYAAIRHLENTGIYHVT